MICTFLFLFRTMIVRVNAIRRTYLNTDSPLLRLPFISFTLEIINNINTRFVFIIIFSNHPCTLLCILYNIIHNTLHFFVQLSDTALCTLLYYLSLYLKFKIIQTCKASTTTTETFAFNILMFDQKKNV